LFSFSNRKFKKLNVSVFLSYWRDSVSKGIERKVTRLYSDDEGKTKIAVRQLRAKFLSARRPKRISVWPELQKKESLFGGTKERQE